MQTSKDFIREQGWLSRISFKTTPRVMVKLISDEKRTIIDNTGKEVKGIAIKVEQDGEEKEIFTSSISLISQLADYEPGSVVVIEMKSTKTNQGYRTSFKVLSVKDGEVLEKPEEEMLNF